MRSERLMAVLAASGMALAGCGDDSSGGGSGGAGGTGGQTIDACALVTEDDATTLFGDPASPGDPDQVPGLLGACIWEWSNADNDSHLLQFYVWDGEPYYSAPADSETFAIGEKGYVRIHDVAGVDIQWVQGNLVPSLSYFTIGSSMPKASTKAEQVKALAQKVSAELP